MKPPFPGGFSFARRGGDIINLKAIALNAYAKSHSLSETLKLAVRLFGKDAEFREEDHPRGKGGKFAPKGSGGGAKSGEINTTNASAGKPTMPSATNGKALTPGQKKRADEIVRSLTGSKHPKVNQSKQQQHENAKAAADATKKDRAAHPKVFRWAKSYFTVKMQAAHDMVLSRVRAGKYTVEPGFGNEVHLLVDVEKNIGFWYNRKDQKQQTSVVRVDYSSKDGYHIFPAGDDDK